MHEVSVARRIVEAARETAVLAGVDFVWMVTIRISQQLGIGKGALRFAFETASEGTVCDGAILEIKEVPAKMTCPKCRKAHPMRHAWIMMCPHCGTPCHEIVAHRDLEIVSIEVAANRPFAVAT